MKLTIIRLQQLSEQDRSDLKKSGHRPMSGAGKNAE